MGSDWTWELRVPVAAESAMRQLYALAAERNLHPQRPDGRINLFTKPDADLRTVKDPDIALAAMATGTEHGQLWTNDDIDIFVNWEDGRLVWALDACFAYRRPVPEADTFRELHGRLTSLWLDVAQRLNAHVGRVLDEWSSDQIWHRGIHDAVHPAGGWPAELGWWTYLGPDHRLPPPPLLEVATHTRRLPNGALLVTLLDDPAAVDPLRYEDIHNRWLRLA
ncbi:hypothetical protein FHX75_111227 [Micromonospora palomenae]|uniref:Immunity protein 52 of polymorphic toxin system n=1 Tax=Micromonospora palomenae TaxID=1461247 RepID=A0A561WW33_9ACTN|nr:hypothetical protein [Micromonospora palomenae]TWG28076.1 hypothetical protein FHX75_111227 [Micromonospora palomenae]